METLDTTRFHITYSPFKCCMWALACMMISTLTISYGVYDYFTQSSFGFFIVLTSFGLFMGYGAISLLVLSHKGEPIAIFTQEGYEGKNWRKWQRYPWTTDTKVSWTDWSSFTIFTAVSDPKVIGGISKVIARKNLISVTKVYAKETITEIEAAYLRLNPHATLQV